VLDVWEPTTADGPLALVHHPLVTADVDTDVVTLEAATRVDGS